MRNFISQNLASDLYKSLVEPHFMYADVVYDAAAKKSKQLLQTKQNNALRVVANVDRQFSATAVHRETNIPWLDTLRKERCCVEVYKALNGLSPPSISNLFVQPDHGRSLRSSSAINFVPPRNRTTFSDNNFVNRSYKYWQQIPLDVRNSASLQIFKNNVKSGGFFVHETYC